MSSYFWQLKEQQRIMDQLQRQLKAIESISRPIREQVDYLASIQNQFTLPSYYLREVARLREVFEQSYQTSHLKGLAESQGRAIQEIVQRQRELDDVARRLAGVNAEIYLPRQRVLESLASAEALVKTEHLRKEFIAVAMKPQMAFQEFAGQQLKLAATASEMAKRNRLTLVDVASDLLQDMSKGIELAALMGRPLPEFEPSSYPAVNIYKELSLEIGEVDFEKEIDIEGTVLESEAAQVTQMGGQLVHLVYDLNAEAEREGKPAVFKPTNKTLYSCSIIPTRIATDERSFFEIVDGLYFLLYEGSGEADRLTERCLPHYLEVLWRLKHLRLGARHDVDHGKDKDIARKNHQVGDAYKALIGMAIPRSRTDWAQAQVALYEQLVQMLKSIWFGGGPDQVVEQEHRTPYEIYEELDLGPGGYAVAPSTEIRRGVQEAIRRKLNR